MIVLAEKESLDKIAKAFETNFPNLNFTSLLVNELKDINKNLVKIQEL